MPQIQAIWFRADTWTRTAAKAWTGENGFEPVAWRSRKDDDGKITHHIAVMFQPEDAKEGTFATIADDFPEGISATTAERKNAMDPITKTGEQSAENPFTFIMSTDTVDRDGDIVRPDGIKLTNFRKNPVALFGHDHKTPIGQWANVRVEGNKLLGDLKLAAKGTSDFIDTLHKLIEQRILRAVSIGFSAKDAEWLPDKSGLDFTDTELLEASLVSVPAQQEALRVKAAKIVPREFLDVFTPEDGKGSIKRARKPSPVPPKSAQKGLDPTPKPSEKGKKPMNIAERIRAKNERLVAVKDRITEIKGLLEADDDYELTDEEQEEIDALSEETKSLEKSIQALETMEKAVAARSQNPSGAKPSGTNTVPARAARKEVGGDLLIKTMVVKLIAHMTQQPQQEVMESMYGDDPRVKEVQKVYGNTRRFQKTGVESADTTTPGWAAELVNNDVRGFLDDLRAVSVYAQLMAATGATSLEFGGANSVTIPSRNRNGQNGGAATGLAAAAHLGQQIGGAFVGENGVIPVKAMAITSQVLNRFKLAVISTFTGELMEQSRPNIEALVRSAILEDTALAVDGALLDGRAAVAGVRPASPFSGAANQASAGATAANIITDIKYLLGALSGINGANPVLLMNSNRLLGLSTVTNAAGAFMFREDISSGRLLGVPVLSSTSVNPDTVGIIDAGSFVGAVDTPAFAVSDQATLTMANADGTAPTQGGDATDHTGGDLGQQEQVPPDGGIIVAGDTTGAPAGTSVTGYQAQSLWQSYTTGVRMIMPASWGMTRAGASAYLTGVAW